MQQMAQQLKEAESGMEKARIDAAAKVEVAEINAVSKQDAEELKGMIQLLVAKASAPPEVAAAGMERQDQPSPGVPPPEERADRTHEILEQMVALMAQPREPVHVHVGSSGRKRMQIQAPSGALYTGQVEDEPDDDMEPGQEVPQ
jgi:biotin synthase-related radical SAM superfamily protein